MDGWKLSIDPMLTIVPPVPYSIMRAAAAFDANASPFGFSL
jgi:hypothetical protein